MAVVNPGSQEFALAAPLKFYGIPTPKNTLAPEAFLRELKARQTKHKWDDVTTIRYMVSCLTGEAYAWWTGAAQANIDGNVPDSDPNEKFATFEALFREHNFLGGATYRANWGVVLRQQKDEATSTYMSRAFSTLRTFVTHHADGFSPDVTVPNMGAIVDDIIGALTPAHFAAETIEATLLNTSRNLTRRTRALPPRRLHRQLPRARN